MNYRMLAAAAAISVCALGSASCSDDDDPGGPSGPPTTFVFTTTLLPGNEVPPIVAPNVDATASGTATVTMTVTRDAGGAITAATTVFVINVTGFPAGTTLTLAHIHNAAAGVNGGVFVNTGLSSTVIPTGATTLNLTAPATTVAQAEAIIASPAGHYVNVHTSVNGPGAIRGQLTLQSSQ
jgi:hypothetical protein